VSNVYRGMRLPSACAVVLTGLSLLLSSCGGSAGHKRATAAAVMGATSAIGASSSSASLDGPTVSSPTPAPALRLRNYHGREVRLSSYRGKAVLLTFIYTHCHDVCPLIAAELHEALGILGRRASEVQVIGVTVDPRGDTPAAIAAFLAKHQMTGRMQYLVGTRAQLEPVWHRWRVSASLPNSHHQVMHTALVYGISGSGKVMTVYPANFAPTDIAHDVPILAKL